MARSRNIKPGLFKNEILGEADPIYSLAFAGLWTLADKKGRLEYRPKKIKAELFPYRFDLDLSIILDWLKHESFINMYEVDGKTYLQINNWNKHQSPHHKEVGSEIPDEVEAKKKPYKQEDSQAQAKLDSSTTQAQANQSASCPTDSLDFDSLDSDSLINNVVVSPPALENHAPDVTTGKPKPIDGWQPSSDTLEALEKIHHVPDKFVTEQIAEFKIYWRDQGKLDVSWDAKFLVRCAEQWKRNGDTWREKPKPKGAQKARDMSQEERMSRDWAKEQQIKAEEQQSNTEKVVSIS